MGKDSRLFVIQMLECVQRIFEYTADGRESFLASRLLQDGVARNLQILGEAAKRVPEADRLRAADLPWRGLAGLRDVIVHQYEGIDPVQIWNVVAHELVPIEQRLRQLLEALELDAGSSGE